MAHGGGGARTRGEESVGLRLRIRSDLRHFERYRELARRFLAAELLPADCVDDLVLVLDECLTNVARHSYAESAEQSIRVQIDLECGPDGRGEHLYVAIVDQGGGGEGFDPATRLASNLERLAAGEQSGLGLLLLFEIMDQVGYRSVPGENCLTLHKAFGRKSTGLPRMIDEIRRTVARTAGETGPLGRS
ncbi:MAG TPA: ATP-binding protein [Oscillatoriaceae cyanobacterium]